MGEGQFPVRQAVNRFSSQAGTQARPIVLLHQPQGDGLSPINPSPPLPAIGTGRPLTTYSLPSMRSGGGTSGRVPRRCRSPCYGAAVRLAASAAPRHGYAAAEALAP